MNGAAWEKTLSCYINMKRYNEALATLDTITLHFPDYENGTLKRAFILDKMDKTEEALQLYLSAIEQSDEDMRIFYVIGYEELTVPCSFMNVRFIIILILYLFWYLASSAFNRLQGKFVHSKQ